MSEVKLYVKHNAEIAHRLANLPGKCQNIHGHSLQVEMWLMGRPDEHGIVIDFHEMKRKFRTYLDENYDHRLLLNENDELIKKLLKQNLPLGDFYPGYRLFRGDPSVENLTQWVHSWTEHTFTMMARVRIQETNSNGAECGF
jgi:6-pyruvoyltetrahydropterin/6-carboxytetrahydropterin synthase